MSMGIIFDRDYDVGFPSPPNLDSLDTLMQDLGFAIEMPGQREGSFTRVYTQGGDIPRLEFYYKDRASELAPGMAAYGMLTLKRLPTLEFSGNRLQRREPTQDEVLLTTLWNRTAISIRERFGAHVENPATGEGPSTP